MAEKKVKKCSPGKFCDTLFDRSEAGNFGKGLRILTIHNMKTNKSRLLITYRKDAKDRGIILNVCPWCGGKLHNEK